jgi:hypothetical protein
MHFEGKSTIQLLGNVDVEDDVIVRRAPGGTSKCVLLYVKPLGCVSCCSD